MSPYPDSGIVLGRRDLMKLLTAGAGSLLMTGCGPLGEALINQYNETVAGPNMYIRLNEGEYGIPQEIHISDQLTEVFTQPVTDKPDVWKLNLKGQTVPNGLPAPDFTFKWPGESNLKPDQIKGMIPGPHGETCLRAVLFPQAGGKAQGVRLLLAHIQYDQFNVTQNRMVVFPVFSDFDSNGNPYDRLGKVNDIPYDSDQSVAQLIATYTSEHYPDSILAVVDSDTPLPDIPDFLVGVPQHEISRILADPQNIPWEFSDAFCRGVSYSEVEKTLPLYGTSTLSPGTHFIFRPHLPQSISNARQAELFNLNHPTMTGQRELSAKASAQAQALLSTLNQQLMKPDLNPYTPQVIEFFDPNRANQDKRYQPGYTHAATEMGRVLVRDGKPYQIMGTAAGVAAALNQPCPDLLAEGLIASEIPVIAIPAGQVLCFNPDTGVNNFGYPSLELKEFFSAAKIYLKDSQQPVEKRLQLSYVIYRLFGLVWGIPDQPLSQDISNSLVNKG